MKINDTNYPGFDYSLKGTPCGYGSDYDRDGHSIPVTYHGLVIGWADSIREAQEKIQWFARPENAGALQAHVREFPPYRYADTTSREIAQGIRACLADGDRLAND